ncbi:MAG: site-specific DNA-methyltransferase [Bacteroidia bacterium]|nr:site-specific DNA-methyltransferase [Bacteroidia bacterium]
MGKRLNGSSTSAFGASARVSHDSSAFYARQLIQSYQAAFPPQPYTPEENELPAHLRNQILCKSAEDMGELPSGSVHLMVTSPPYNVGKTYDADLTFEEYRAFLKRVWREVYRVLVPGGRACINVANLGRKPYIPLHAFIIQDMLEIGFLMRGEIIWVKEGGGAPSTAWGSWKSAQNPVIRDEHEYILIFSKGTYSRTKLPHKQDTMTQEEFLTYTRSVWYMRPASAKQIGHPAPFPEELPYRLIQLYTFAGEVILDPFMGSGQTAIAAIRAGRYFVGYEVEEEYVKLSTGRVALEGKLSL